jgi:hypothetical protein
LAADRFYFGPMFERQKVGKPVDDAGNVGRGRASGFGGTWNPKKVDEKEGKNNIFFSH